MTNNTAPVRASAPVRILVVEDDDDARWLAVEALTEHGYLVSEARDGPAALASIDDQPPGLVVLDLGLPGIGGLDILRSLRANRTIPVIVLSGRGDTTDRVVGLELGADDYLAKPFDARELVARVAAVLRRTQQQPSSQILNFGDLVIDLTTRDVSCDGNLVELTAKEFDLLSFLAASPRQVFTREQILQSVWNSSAHWQDPKTVNEHIHRLRRKIGAGTRGHGWVETMRGAGYRFTP